MSTLKSEVPNADLKTNQGFRDFVSHVRNVFETVNPTILTRTSDTGQIDPLTVSTPLTTSSIGTVKVGGYDVFLFNDTKKPLYIKIYYCAQGTSSSTNLNKMVFVLKADIGLTTDGAGTIGNIIYSGFLRKTDSTSTPNASKVNDRGVHYTYCCVLDGYLSFHFDVGSKLSTYENYPNDSLTTESHSLIISRQLDNATFLIAVNSDNTTFDYNQGTNSLTNRYRDFYFMVANLNNGYFVYPQKEPNWASYITSDTGNGTIGTDVYVKRFEYFSNDGVYKDPNILLYWVDDFGYEQDELLTIDGVSSNFIFLPPALRTTYPYMNIAMRWE